VVIGVWDILAAARSNAPLAAQAALAGQRRAERASRDAAAASLLESAQTLVTSKDAAEGMAAMMGRRDPVFRGE
jgi:enoyl-CoA hydratase/carnithine racemase